MKYPEDPKEKDYDERTQPTKSDSATGSAAKFKVVDKEGAIPANQILSYFREMCASTQRFNGCENDKSFEVGFAMGMRCAEKLGWIPPNA